jgi:hypothetical protein
MASSWFKEPQGVPSHKSLIRTEKDLKIWSISSLLIEKKNALWYKSRCFIVFIKITGARTKSIETILEGHSPSDGRTVS